MRLAPISILSLLLARSTSLALGQAPITPVLACHVRGPQTWLATRPSPLDSVVLTVSGTSAKICYSRPHARGRSVDSLVPPGPAWRLGANEPTTISLTNKLNIGGALLSTGRYVVLAIPGVKRWSLVFYTTPDTEPAKMFQNLTQIATGTGEVERVGDPLEQFTISAERDSTVSSLLLGWGTWRVRIPVRPAL